MELIKALPWTAILCAIVMIIGSIAKYFVDKHLKPYLKSHGLIEAAAVAVEAAEAMYGRLHGDEKLEYAINALREQGYDVDTKQVKDAIYAAWQNLDIKQIDAGIKEAA